MIQLTRAARNPFENDPPEDEDRRMVIDMQECQLAILFPNHNKHRVHQLDYFAEEMQPNVVGDLQGKLLLNRSFKRIRCIPLNPLIY